MNAASFLYSGDDEGHPSPATYALFEYASLPVAHDDDGDDDGDGDGEDVDGVLAPDDPEALAPREGVELCALVVKEVVRFNTPAGPCTWVLGQSLSLGRYLWRAYPGRAARIVE